MNECVWVCLCLEQEAKSTHTQTATCMRAIHTALEHEKPDAVFKARNAVAPILCMIFFFYISRTLLSLYLQTINRSNILENCIKTCQIVGATKRTFFFVIFNWQHSAAAAANCSNSKFIELNCLLDRAYCTYCVIYCETQNEMKNAKYELSKKERNVQPMQMQINCYTKWRWNWWTMVSIDLLCAWFPVKIAEASVWG